MACYYKLGRERFPVLGQLIRMVQFKKAKKPLVITFQKYGDFYLAGNYMV
jgi:hypothetical protein